MRRRKKYFHERSRTYRKKAYRNYKRRIEKAAPYLGGLFYTHDCLTGDNVWLDIDFLSRKYRNRPYSMTIATAQHEYVEKVQDTVWDRAWDLVKPPPVEWRDVPGNEHLSEMIFPEELPCPEFDGLTREEWRQREIRKLADSGEVQIFEEAEIATDYCYAVGLHVTVDVAFLTKDVVQAWIEEWLKTEEAYLRDKPLTWKYEECQWGIFPNQICTYDAGQGGPDEPENVPSDDAVSCCG